MKRNIIVLIWVVLLGYRINLVGSISLTELYVIIQIPVLWKWMSKSHFIELTKLRNLFLCLFGCQCLSEFVLGNSVQNAVKGLMITVMAFFVLLFFMREIIGRKVSLIMIPLGMIISQLLFGDQFGFAESGDESVWFKFYVVPLVMNGACVLFLLNKKWVKRNVVLIFLCSSILMMAGGSRTGGFTMLLSLMLYLAVKRTKQLSWSKLLKALVPILIIAEIFYAFIYVPKVKSGEWGSEQNRIQMATIDYSKNALMLVMAARTDFFVSLTAFMDKPLWGHGAWAKDESLEYAMLFAQLTGKDEDKVVSSADHWGVPLIPCHSVLVAMGTRNGILAFVCFFAIFLFVYKKSFFVLMKQKTPYISYLVIASIQAVLFSPPAILKGSIAVMWAVLLAFYFIETKSNKNEIIRSNCNL